MTLEIAGKFTRKEDGLGLANFRIEIYAIDQIMFDDIIGETYSNESGEFKVLFDDKDFLKKFGDGYGIYLIIYNPKDVMISNGRYGENGKIKWGISSTARFDMSFSKMDENQGPPDFDSLF